MARSIRAMAMLLCAASTGAFGANNGVQVAAVQQFSVLTAPRLEPADSTDPQVEDPHIRMVDGLPPQDRAERSLELAIHRYAGAADYVVQNAQDWRGKIESNDRLAAMTLAAMNSSHQEVRMAGFEVQLALNGVAKTPAGVEHLIQRLHEDPHGVGAWMLWNLAVIGARGVDRERIFAVLVAAAHVSDDGLRQWAAQALAMFGGTEVVAPLLSIAAGDRAQSVREAAFCGLAQAATLRPGERNRALRGLLAIASDPHSDRQDIEWSYRALREISGISDLPGEPLAWRTRLEGLGLMSRP